LIIPYKNFLISLFFLASCSKEISDNQQNLSKLMQPNQNYFISQYESTLSQNNNLNDLDQYIPKLSQLLKNHSFEYQLDFYFSDSQDHEITNFIINIKNKQSIHQQNLSLFINSKNNIFQCLQKNNNLVATTLIPNLLIGNHIFYLKTQEII
jgi:hypothetical protein